MSMTLSRQFSPVAPKSPAILPVICIAVAATLLLITLSLVLPPASTNADTAETAALLVGP